MRNLGVILFLGILFFGCEPRLKPEKPQNLIPKDKMTLVLYDMFVINSAKGINRLKLEKNGINPERYILTKHSIDSVQFAKSNDYYAHDLEVYDEIINDVKNKVTSEKAKYEALVKAEKEKLKVGTDSLKSILKKLPLEDKSLNNVKKSD